ncbi:hypothetical protein BK816_05690 [Boudabousia tangfeifanii]|uniref:UDP-N-acetylmuramyl-tripeptide synthetase n=2 Tax=Boudabousia tangfeifanii TaxID=1912795 RepID=A0A1D9MMG1_9ACTO|nr:hypothetical protein BK816_05690 [Boudabousia tangfeifanii]
MAFRDFAPVSNEGVTIAELCQTHGLACLQGEQQTVIKQVSLDSQQVLPQGLFIALPGAKTHGIKYLAGALKLGATAVLTDPAGAEQAFEAGELPKDFVVLTHPQPRQIAGEVAAQIFSSPSQAVAVYGVTGTNGKTTTTYLLRAALGAKNNPQAQDQPLVETKQCGVIGTVAVEIGGAKIPSVRTSVEAPLLQQLLAYAKEKSVPQLAIEVSSHALELGRVNATKFKVVGFLNLQRDHLDFHGTMEDYFQAKAKLFTPKYATQGVVCIDDEWGQKLAKTSEIDVVTVAVEKVADWTAKNLQASEDHRGTHFELHGPQGQVVSALAPLPGNYNVENTAMAIVMAIAGGVEPQLAADAIAHSAQVPGRMQVAQGRTDTTPLVVVDYAHTTDALTGAIAALRDRTEGNMLVVFGATGERDRGKRADMGQTVCAHAEVALVTEDDPYDEDPAQIRKEVLAGCPNEPVSFKVAKELLATPDHTRESAVVLEIDGREKAIITALKLATPQDTVLLAGRGHETIQMVAGVPVHLDDNQVVVDYYASGEESHEC